VYNRLLFNKNTGNVCYANQKEKHKANDKRKLNSGLPALFISLCWQSMAMPRYHNRNRT
jgi:hypothetical protein